MKESQKNERNKKQEANKENTDIKENKDSKDFKEYDITERKESVDLTEAANLDHGGDYNSEQVADDKTRKKEDSFEQEKHSETSSVSASVGSDESMILRNKKLPRTAEGVKTLRRNPSAFSGKSTLPFTHTL